MTPHTDDIRLLLDFIDAKSQGEVSRLLDDKVSAIHLTALYSKLGIEGFRKTLDNLNSILKGSV